MKNLENEIWKPVAGWESIYKVSNKGRVSSIDRVVFNEGNKANCNLKGVVLVPSTDTGGYKYVTLYDRKENKRVSLKIHRLVAFAFCDGFSDWKEVNHIDGVRTNNFAENLEWVTRAENIRHKYVLGYHQKGERGSVHKLQNRDVGVIISLYLSGVSQSIIAKAFNVCQKTISNAILGRTFEVSCLLESGDALPIEEDGK